MAYLDVAEHVVDETCQGGVGLGSHHTYAPQDGATHGALNEAEYVLHTASNPRLLAVSRLLPVGQGVGAVSLFAYDRLHARMLYDLFAALVTVVGIKFLPFVADIKQL